MAKKKNRGKRPPWTPFRELDPDHWRKVYTERYGKAALSPDSAGVRRVPDRVFENSRYTVFMHAIPQPGGWPPMCTLSIRMHTRDVIRDWRDLQRIKNEIVGEECEAVELFPAESRLVDNANQFHLWCITDPGKWFPFGFTRRAVTDGDGKPDFTGARQRKMENPPPDAISQEDAEEEHRAALRRGAQESLEPGEVDLDGDA